MVTGLSPRLPRRAPFEVHPEKENHTQGRVLQFSHALGIKKLNLGKDTVGTRNSTTRNENTLKGYPFRIPSFTGLGRGH
jgi:hypothetical protein